MVFQISLGDKAPAWAHQIRSGLVPFFSLSYLDEADAFRQVSDLLPLVFDKGRIQFDRFTVKRPVFSEQSVTWAHQSNRGFTSGNLMYAKGGTELHGMVSIGDDAETATEFHVFATALPLSEYATTLVTDGGDTTNGPILRIGLRTGQGMAPRMSVFLDAVDVTHSAVQSLDAETGRPVLDILLSGIPDQPRLSGASHIVFDIGDNGTVSFSGKIVALGADGNVVVTRWAGQRREPVAVESALVEAETPPLAFVDAILPSGESALTDEEVESKKRTDAVLDILGLRPDDNDVSNASMAFMMENMKFAMWEDPSDDDVTSRRKWVENYFKERKPIIADQGRIGVIREQGEWYRQTMATAILGNSVASQSFDSKVVPRPINEERRNTLKTYVEKLGSNKVFASQQAAMWRTVYFSRAPSLKTYLEQDKTKVAARKDKTVTPENWNDKTWAERILEYATTDSQLQIIRDNIMSGPVTSDDAPNKDDKAIADIKEAIAKMEEMIESNLKIISIFEKNPIPGGDAEIKRLKNENSILKTTIDRQDNAISTLQQNKTDHVKMASLTMRNVSSMLYAFDYTGNYAQTYMDCIGSSIMTTMSENADIKKIDDYQRTLQDYLTRFLDDVASNRVTVFGAIDETDDLNELLRVNGLTTQKFAAMMVQGLFNSRSESFIESANEATRTFSQSYPGLTRFYRVGLIATYVFTFIRVLGVVQEGTGSSSTVEKVMTYGSFSLLAVETFRSLGANIRNFFTSMYQPAGVGAEAAAIPLEAGAFRLFCRRIGQALARAARVIVQAVRSGATWLAEKIAANACLSYIRDCFSSIMQGVGDGVGWVRSRFANLVDSVNASPTWSRVASFISKGFDVIIKGAVIVASVWTTVTAGINMVDVWKTSDSGWQKALVTIEFAAIAASTVATIVGVFSSAVIWSGAGAILAIASLGIGMIVSLLWPPESTIQKMISEVFVPFIDNTAGPSLKSTLAVVAPSELKHADIDMTFGRGNLITA